MSNYKAKQGQDRWVLGVLENKKNGYFVDIGATGGKVHNNSYVLEKDFGWKGICVEPNPNFRAFQSLVKERNCECENVCIYSQETTLDFIARGRHPEASGIYADFTCPHITDRVSKRGHPTVKVQAITLLQLLDRHKAPATIDYLSIDAEGCEWEILKDFDFTKYTFLTATIEHSYNEESPVEKYLINRDNIRKLLAKHNYIFKKQLWFGEDWFVHRSVDKDDQK